MTESEHGAIPRTLVLNYITRGESPTRVRVVAGRAAMIVGIVAVVLVIVVGWHIADRTYDMARELTAMGAGIWGPGGFVPAPPRPIDLTIIIESLRYSFRYNPLEFILFPFVLTGAILLPLIARSITRGRRAASLLACGYFVLAIPLVIGLAVIVGCHAWVDGVVFHYGSRVGTILGLMAFPVGGLVALLFKDFCAYLLWIARNPVTDKPPVAFLPGKSER